MRLRPRAFFGLRARALYAIGVRTERGDLTIAEAVRSLRLSPRRGYIAAAVVFALATAIAYLAMPAVREALFVCYFPAIVLGTLLGGGYAGLMIAVGGGLSIWFWLYPVSSAQDALALMLYVDAAVVLLWALDMLNRAFDLLLAERDTARLLLRENQHRTANNLMFIAAFLRAQRSEVRGNAHRAIATIDQAVHRLDTVSALYRQLANPVQEGDSVPHLFRQVCDALIEAAGARNVTVSMEIDPVELEIEQVMLLSLLLAEIVTNALKYAFEGKRNGLILILLSEGEREHIFEVRDDGPGILQLPHAGQSGTGHRIVEMLVAQLGGRLTLTNEGGLCTRLTFPRR